MTSWSAPRPAAGARSVRSLKWIWTDIKHRSTSFGDMPTSCGLEPGIYPMMAASCSSAARKTKPGQVAIGSVGGAVEALVRGIAREVAPKRINIVSPGTIDTPMVAAQGEERATFYAKATASNIIPRAGTADEVAQGIIFLIQNDFVTGTTVDVDGGWLLS